MANDARIFQSEMDEPDESPEFTRRLLRRHVAITLTVFVPLILAFLRITNFYPVPVWALFIEKGDLQGGHVYYVLRGEDQTGRIIDIPAIKITNALTGRNFMFVHYVDDNASYRVTSPHPSNVAELCALGGESRLPRGAGMPSLLRAWGAIYNGRLAAHAPERLKSIQLDAYRWPGGHYSNYRVPVYSWRVDL
jgi:hypothetical protein